MSKQILGITAVSGFLAVCFGAFGAHGLEALLTAERLDTYQTGVDYHFYHTLALAAVGVLAERHPQSRVLLFSAAMFIGGIVIFSGSLYLLALSGISWLGAITPLGGVAFLLGWAALLRFAWQLRPDQN